MRRHFYAVFGTYYPNAAPTNRMLSYLEAWSKMDVEVTVVFTEPDRHFSRLKDKYSNIHVWYIWEEVPTTCFVLHKIMLWRNVNQLLKKLKDGDNIYLYGQAYTTHKLLTCKKNIKLYQERTEHPLVTSLGIWPFKVTIGEYLNDCRHLDGIFVISHPLKEYFIGVGVDEEKIQIVNMTVDPSRFEGISKHNDVKRYVAYCGNASNNKDGADQLIRAFALISSQNPQLYLYIIGQAPNRGESNNNISLAHSLGVGDKVVFTGSVSYSDMPQLLKDASILALDRPDSLQAKYGFPTKLGEYLLTGNPVVLTRVGDIPRFITDGENGMLSEPSDPDEFSFKLNWLLKHPSEASEIGKKGRETALEHFNSRKEAGKIVNFIFNKSIE